jgi:alcohol dehydrogenase (NADP+)
MFAAALGAEVSVLSHSPNKKEDAMKLGAKEFISTKDKDWQKPHSFKWDFIINAADNLQNFNLPDYFGCLKVHGTFHNVG